MYIGAHVSVSGGLAKAAQRGETIEAEAIQIFTSNQHRWAGRDIGEHEAAAFRQALAESKIQQCVSHGSYLLNLASPDDKLWHKSIAALIKELQRCELLGIDDLVIHPGAHRGKGVEWGITRIAAALDMVFESLPDLRCHILLETIAGQGTGIGSTIEELAEIISLCTVRPEMVGICLDTAHLFAAGVPLSTDKDFNRFVTKLHRTVGLPRVRAIHLNDSARAFGSRVDRHALIGEGEMELSQFKYFVRCVEFEKVPGIAETPVNQWQQYAEEIVKLKSLRSS